MRRLLLSLALASASGLCACGGGSSGSNKVKIRLVPNVVAAGATSMTASPLTAATDNGVSARASALRIGSPSAMNLKSLKYFIRSIQLCQDVQLMGSGYSNTNGCIDLYMNDAAGAPDYDNYLVTQAQADTTPDRFVDLMTAAGQAALRRPVTLEIPAPPPMDDGGSSPSGEASDGSPPSQVGAYRFGLINFYRPIKVTAEFPIIGQPDQYFRTRAVTGITAGRTFDGRFNTERVQIGDTLSGPTEETTYMLNNGGALFTFQKPFVITQADVDAHAEIKIDLVFNPENFGQAYESSGCLDDANTAICDPANRVAIDMPFVHMNPVPRKAGEKTRKETYLMDYDSSTKLRIELYYNDADGEAGVQGVDTAVIYVSATNQPANNVIATNFVSQTGSIPASDATVSMLDYQRTPTLTGLVRRQNGTATVHCVFTGALCPTPGVTLQRAYTFLGDSVVSSD